MTRIKLLLFGIAYLFLLQYAIGQSIHYTPFYATPVALNPTFTGMFDGNARVNTIYRSNMANATLPYRTLPYTTFGASVDAPLATAKDGSYVAGGIQYFNDAGDEGFLRNFTGMVSLSYHKPFGKRDSARDARFDIAGGVQAGYLANMTDYSRLYFYDKHSFNGMGPDPVFYAPINVYAVSAGLSFSHAASRHFNYTIGVSANNINQPTDAIEHATQYYMGVDRYYSAVWGANWLLQKRLLLQPALLYEVHESLRRIVAGTDINIMLGKLAPGKSNVSVYAGLWYRSGDMVTFCTGVECGRIKVGIGLDNNHFRSTERDNNALELTFKYTAPNLGLKLPKRSVPCNRF
jgi:type IX secretion system PorP/SprF family membrane protein